MQLESAVSILAGLMLAPLMPGIINRTKAVFAGRRGAPLLQAYYDIFKLLRKGAVYSRTTSWVFRAAPCAGLACLLVAFAFMPAYGSSPALEFSGDLIVFIYCLGLMRFMTVAAALDTGSSFEGMGASREVQFSALGEPVLILSLASVAFLTGQASLSGIFGTLIPSAWHAAGPVLVLVSVALFIVFLAENARIPVDDPNTHLELTMIHEVMILDYSGPDLAFVLYGASLKLWLLGAMIVNLLLSAFGTGHAAGIMFFIVGMFLLAVAVGVVESAMARLSLLRVPQLLAGAGALSVLAFILVMRFIS